MLGDGSTLADVSLASNGDVGVLMDAVANAARPIDGTQDAESSRRSVREALSDLLERYPDADLLALSDDQREFVIERFAAMDVYGRFLLDMQSTVMDKSPDIRTAMTRLRQIREYIQSTVATAFQSVRDAGAPTVGGIAALTRAALKETFRVFESYL
ncbi:MAG: hypothetical protein J0G30_12475 [Actinomycetales bacterium]|nr:hypothetical protein [Actinomycetales bacterium]